MLWKDCGCHVHLHSRKTNARSGRPTAVLVIKGPHALEVAKWVLEVSKVALAKLDPQPDWQFMYPNWVSLEAFGHLKAAQLPKTHPACFRDCSQAEAGMCSAGMCSVTYLCAISWKTGRHGGPDAATPG